jgi:hypothetical protein
MVAADFSANRADRSRQLEILLALVLLTAAGLKGHALYRNASPILAGLVHTKILFASIIQAEIFLSIWLLTGGLPRSRFLCAIGSFCIFAAAAIYEAVHSLPTCGCFGEIKVPPMATAGFDILVVIALWFSRPPLRAGAIVPTTRNRLIAGITAAGICTTGLWAVVFFKAVSAHAENAVSAQAEGNLVVLDPASWLNKPFPLFDDIDGSNQLHSGRWLLVMYHYDCDSCLQAIPNYSILASQSLGSRAPRIAFLAMPPVDSPGQDPVRSAPNYVRLILRANHNWFATTPVVVAIQDGQVLLAIDGEMAIHPPEVAQWRR